jgi:hypothetical protein
MGFFDRIRNALAGPPHIDDSDRNEGPEIDAAMAADFGGGDKGAADVKRYEATGGSGPLPGLGGLVGGQAAEEDLESEAAPPDLDP